MYNGIFINENTIFIDENTNYGEALASNYSSSYVHLTYKWKTKGKL